MITEEELALTIAKTINRLNDIMRLDDDVSRDELLLAYEALNVSRPEVRLEYYVHELLNIIEATKLANLNFEFGFCECGAEYYNISSNGVHIDGTGIDDRCDKCWIVGI